MMRKKLLLFFLLLLTVLVTYPLPSDYFAILHKTAPKERIAVARRIFNDQVLHLDSANALAALHRLLRWADEKKDVPLQVFSLIAMGDYQKQGRGMHATGGLQYFKKALELAKAQNLIEQEAEIYNNMGLILYKLNKYPQAFEYMIRANNIIQNEIGYENYPHSGSYLFDLGLMYYDFGNFEKAKQYLSNAIKFPFSNSLAAIRTYNTLALAYTELKNNDSAVVFFQRALNIANASHDVAWTGILSGNLGMIYYGYKKYDTALPLLKIDYTLSKQTEQWASVQHTLVLMADIDIERNDLEAAASKLDEIASLFKKENAPRTYLFYALKKARLFKRLKRYDSAFVYLDTARRLQNELREKQDAMIFMQAEQKVAVEKHLADMKVLASEKSKSLLVRNFLIVVILLCFIIAGQFIFRLQIRQKKNKELLKDASARLNYYIDNVREKNKLIEQFKREIKELHALPDHNILLKEKEEISEKLKRYTILTEDHWNEFRQLFEKVQKGFFDNLKQKYPDLTPAEQRLLALLKLKLSRREMAAMLGIAPDSIKKTRQRIRRKINLQDDDELEELVDNI